MSAHDAAYENTYVIDAESATEMARLMNQDRIVTENMGYLLPEQLDLTHIENVLDIACGPGGWALNMAYAYPKIKIVGVDISKTMINYARAQAQSQGLDNVSFEIMNALQPFPFPDSSFGGINARFMVGFMPKAYWPTLIQECWRVTRPGGFICLTESDEFSTSNSPASEEGKVLFFQALQKVGMVFPTDHHSFGITPLLSNMLKKTGYSDVMRKAHTIDFSAGTGIHRAMFDNFMTGVQLIQGLLTKTGVATQAEAEELLQQQMIEMLSDDFCALWYYLSVWGIKPAAL